MKKGLLFIAVLATCISMANAQTVKIHDWTQAPKVQKVTEVQKVQNMVTAESYKTDIVYKQVESAFTDNAKAPAADLSAYYVRPAGTLLGGIQSNGRGYVPLYVGNGLADWKFINQSTGYTGIEWLINETPNILTMDAQGNGSFVPNGIGNFYMPEVKVTSGSNTDTYYYGKDLVDAGEVSYSLVVGSQPLVMTAADFNYSGMYTGSSATNYVFGTGTTNDEVNIASAQYFEKPQAPLYAEAIGAFIHTNGTAPLSGNAKLTCTVYSMTDDGKLKDELASGDVYKEDLIDAWTFTGGKKVYYARFTFVELDKESGLETEIDLVLDEAYAVVISGLDETGVNAGILFAQNQDMDGNSAVLTDEHLYTYGAYDADNVWRNAYDLAIMIEGAYTALIVDEETRDLEIPAEGGWAKYIAANGEPANDIDVYSTYSDFAIDKEGGDVWIESIPDWITGYDFKDTYFEQYGVLLLFFGADALPAGVTGRAGNIVLGSYGVTATVRLKQGNADWQTTGISNTNVVEITKAVRQGNDFKLSYPASATSVAVYNIAGQKVADHQLNASGTYTLPAANWAHGVYILKFNGSNAAVKVIK